MCATVRVCVFVVQRTGAASAPAGGAVTPGAAGRQQAAAPQRTRRQQQEELKGTQRGILHAMQYHSLCHLWKNGCG